MTDQRKNEHAANITRTYAARKAYGLGNMTVRFTGSAIVAVTPVGNLAGYVRTTSPTLADALLLLKRLGA